MTLTSNSTKQDFLNYAMVICEKEGFTKDEIKRLKIESLVNSYYSVINKYPEEIKIYRFLEKTKNKDIDFDSVGVCWSFGEIAGIWGPDYIYKSKGSTVLVGKIKKENINVKIGLINYLMEPMEKEIRLYGNRTIKIIKIIQNYKTSKEISYDFSPAISANTGPSYTGAELDFFHTRRRYLDD